MKTFLKGKDVILVASSNFESHTKSKLNVHFISEEFSRRGTRVLFVESLGVRDLPIYGKHDLYKVLQRFINFVKLLLLGPRNVSENVYVVSLIKFPFDRLRFIRRINQFIVSYFVRIYAKRCLRPKPLLWIFLPNQWHLARRIPNSGVIYHCVDDYSSIPLVDKSYAVYSERKMVRIADIVLVVSTKKAKEFVEFTDAPIVHMNNVANFAQFNRAVTEKLEPPHDLEKVVKMGRPIVGYVGNLAAYKEDFGLFHDTAKECPNYSFVIIGAVGEGEFITNTLRLRSLHNVYFLGPKDYESLYKYIKFFDIAFIPRKKGKVGEGGFPMKYFEFLSAGLPTVVTGVGTLSKFSKIQELGGVAMSPIQFKKLFDYWIKLKKEDPKAYKFSMEKRIKLAKINSWVKRIDQLNAQVLKIIKD